MIPLRSLWLLIATLSLSGAFAQEGGIKQIKPRISAESLFVGAAAQPGGRPPLLPTQPSVILGAHSSRIAAQFRLIHTRSFEGAKYVVYADFNVNTRVGHPQLARRIMTGVLPTNVSGDPFEIDFTPLIRQSLPPRGQGIPPVVRAQSPIRVIRTKTYRQDLVERLNAEGKLTLYVQIEPAQGDPSPVATVIIGELPPKAGETVLEAKQIVDILSGEFKKVGEDVTWVKSGWLSPKTSFRIKTAASGVAYYVGQWNTEDFGGDWSSWNVGFPPGTSLMGNLHDEGGLPAFDASSLFFVFPTPGNVNQDYYFRVVPFDQLGGLAGNPSNSVKMTLVAPLAGSLPQGKPPEPKVELKITGVDYFAENRNIDDRHWVITENVPPNSLMYGIYKSLAGGKEPVQGTKIYIPPKSGTSNFLDDAASTLGSGVSTLLGYATTVLNYAEKVADVVSTVLFTAAGLPIQGINYGVHYAMDQAGVPDSYIDKFEMVRDAPFYVAGHVMQAADAAHQMTAGQVTAKMWEVVNGIKGMGSKADTLPTIAPFVALDPDYQYRPPRMLIHMKAYATGDAAKGQLSQARSIHVDCRNDWEDASYQLGNGKFLTGQVMVIDSSVQVPPIPDGVEFVVPIYLKFTNAAALPDANWGRAWNSPKASKWTIGGDNYSGLSTGNWSG